MAPNIYDGEEAERSLCTFLVIQGLVLCVLDVVVLLPQCLGTVLMTNSVPALQAICLLQGVTQCLFGLVKMGTNVGGYKQFSSKRKVSVVFQLQRLLHGGVLVFIAALVFHVIAIFFGAPFTISILETFHFGCLMAILTALPLIIHIGADFVHWLVILMGKGFHSPLEKYVFNIITGSLSGAWFGAFPIPLDWDRPWQVWPITCCIGALLGNSLGNIYTSIDNIISLRSSSKREKRL